MYETLTQEEAVTNLVAGKKGAPQIPKRLSLVAMSYLGLIFKERQERLSGFLSQLRPFAIGEISDLVNGETEGSDFFSLSEIVRSEHNYIGQGAIAVVILIPTLMYQKSASRLGQMFLQEIAWALSQRRTKDFLPVFLDEFSSFVYEGFLQSLNKARSSGLAFHLSHQSMGDLEAISPDFAKAVVTNTNVKCVFGVNDLETAEFFAKLFGTKTTTKTTERAERTPFFKDVEMSGQMSVREVEEYRIHPNRLKAFSRGQGAISFMSEGHLITEEIRFEPVPGFL